MKKMLRWFWMFNLLFPSLILPESSAANDFKAKLLVNHIGYEAEGVKGVVFQTNSDLVPGEFVVSEKLSDKVVFQGSFESGGEIDSWHTGNAYYGDFSNLKDKGEFYITLDFDGREIRSEAFTVGDQVIAAETLWVLAKGINSQRTAGDFNEADKKMSFYGYRNDTVDVSGGWYDASGDRGKYISHLNYANFMSPQQAPMVVWNFIEASNNLKHYNNKDQSSVIDAYIDEAAHGADWLVRIQDPEGYFYINVFANWSWDHTRRQICAYISQDGFRTSNYEAGYREGGGMSIAALARAYAEGISGEFSSQKYLEAAIKGFDHLQENNLKYIHNGIENIIDDYTALMAATELYNATQEDRFLAAARVRMENLVNRISSDGNIDNYWRADDEDIRPYFHAAEAGLPLISLITYLQYEDDNEYREKAIDAVKSSVDFEISVTNEVNNPFGYARQYVKGTNEDEKRTAFFIPQNNETGYWWQGENARISSLSAAIYKSIPYIDEDKRDDALKYAISQINWILGMNPYNMTMLEGRGRNNPPYSEGGNELNVTGCVCNGITGGFGDETDIAFRPYPYGEDLSQRWRWSEQWLQHGSWLMLAISEMIK
ncbi:glycoside hydrolase family 9 protein [Marinilabiliaceae bacterium ANBcel2]|nr:glycoside hydrolase family 9 protein [Marinilabiliaceae bacterium ANBcel2]